MMFGGAVIVIGYQSFLMYAACCGGINAVQFAGFFWVTVVFLAVISIGFSLVLNAWLKDEADPSNTQE